MIAAKETASIHVLALGVNPQEHKILAQLARSLQGNFELAEDDLDLWGRVQSNHYDVCVLGQNKVINDPCYLVWLLRGVIPRARIILLYDELSAHEIERLHTIEATHVLVRPVQLDQFARHFDEAIHNRTDDGAAERSIFRRLTFRPLFSWLK